MVTSIKFYVVEVLVTTGIYTSVRQYVLPEDDDIYKEHRARLLLWRRRLDYDAVEVKYGNTDLMLECSGQPRNPVAICHSYYEGGIKYRRELLQHEVPFCVRWHHERNIRFRIEWLLTPER